MARCCRWAVLPLPDERAIRQAGQAADEIALGEFAARGDCLPVDAVLQDHAVLINREVSGEAAGPVTVAPIRQPLVALLDSLDLQRRQPDPRRGDGLRLSRCQL